MESEAELAYCEFQYTYCVYWTDWWFYNSVRKIKQKTKQLFLYKNCTTQISKIDKLLKVLRDSDSQERWKTVRFDIGSSS